MRIKHKKLTPFVIIMGLVFGLSIIITCIFLFTVDAQFYFTQRTMKHAILMYFFKIIVLLNILDFLLTEKAAWHGSSYTLKENPLMYFYFFGGFLFVLIFLITLTSNVSGIGPLQGEIKNIIILVSLLALIKISYLLLIDDKTTVACKQDTFTEPHERFFNKQSYPVASLRQIGSNLFAECPKCQELHNTTGIPNNGIQSKNCCDDYDKNVEGQQIKCDSCQTIFTVPNINLT